MTANIATLKQTSGEGFVFEDNVVAYFLIHLLNGIYPFESKYGLVEEIGLQKRSLGHLLDDLIITTKSSLQYQFAFSIKSNKQITRNGFPQDFVSNCWEQIYNIELPKFIKSQNFLGLITSPLAIDVKTNIDELIKWGREKKRKSVQIEIKTSNKIKQALYESLRCPLDLSKKLEVLDQEPTEILGLLVHLSFDFLSSNSVSEKEAIKYCRDLLASHSSKEAEELWRELISLASHYRTNGSDVSRAKLVSDLDFSFNLVEYPDFKADYEKIRSYTNINLLGIRDVLGNDFHYQRDDELNKLSQEIHTSSVLGVIGRSGSGKSALLKNWVHQNLNNELILWINSNSFENRDFTDFENSFKFSHTLTDICNSSANKSTLIIDAVDNLISEVGFNNLITLLRIFNSSEKNNPWKLIISCQSDDWNRVLYRINKNIPNLNIKTHEIIETESQKIVDEVFQKYDTLLYLKRNKKLKQILFNLKILDVLVSKASNLSEKEVSKWVGESDIVEWYWNGIIMVGERSLVRGNIFKKLASMQGDALINQISLTNFDSGELIEIQNLSKEKLCVISEEKISFSHDLVGDWSRLRVIIGRQLDIEAFLSERITSPLWIKAIRLYGTYLLEQKSIAEWLKIINSFESNKIKIVSDSLLESILFSKNARLNLEEAHAILLADKSELLKRLLKKFLFVCTFPNPMYSIIEGEDETKQIIYSTLERLPNLIYWIPIIFYVTHHSKELIEIIPHLLTEISMKWLKYTPVNFILRKEVAEIAITLAEKQYAYHHSKIMYLDKAGVTKDAYKAAMYAYNDFPDRVKLLARSACSRIEVTSPILDEIKKINSEFDELQKELSEQKEKKIIPSLGSYMGKKSPAWPLGPMKRVDEDFRKVCLDNDALHPIIDNDPELATEIILAQLIKEPRSREFFGSSDFLNSYEIAYEYKWFPPMYFRGPFLYFLRKQPDVAINLIIELVNFATDRWRDRLGENKIFDLQLSIKIEGNEIVLSGNEQIFYWYRDGGSAPHPIVSMLMALEKYLYEQIDEEKNVESYLKKILINSRSLAFCGLMISVGIKKTSLFKGVLKPLLFIPEFHFWELSYSIQPKSVLMIGWELEPQTIRRLAYDWHNLSHRSWYLCSLSEFLLNNYQDFEKIFLEIINKWKQELHKFSPKSSYRIFLENRIELYNKKNYKLTSDADGKQYWEYKEPMELAKKNNKRQKEKKDSNLLLQFPMICKQIINGNEVLNNIEEFIKTLKKIERIKIKEDRFTNVASALSAGIAVLYTTNKKYLEDNPEIKNWCVSQIVKIITNSKEEEEPSSEVDIYDMRWDNFCAYVLPVIWLEDIHSKIIRKCITRIVTIKYYKTIEILCQSAAKIRGELGPNWNKLQNFILMFSAIRGNYSWYEKEDKNFISLSNELNKLFIKDEITSDFISLSLTYQALPKHIHNKLKSINKRYETVDLQLVMSCYKWIVKERFWEQKKEYEQSFLRLTDLFQYTIRKIKERKPRRDDDYGIPDMWDRWVFDYLPIVIIRLDSLKEAEEFWRPIVELGSPYHYYVEDFFKGLFITYFQHVENKNQDDVREKFISNWKGMVDFAINYETWRFNQEKRWYHLDDMAIELMGLNSIYMDFWTNDLEIVVESMKDFYKKWSNEYLLYTSCAVSFVNFLKQPAANSIVLDCLLWIKEGYEKHINFWDEKDIFEPLAYLLNTVWTKKEDQLRKNSKSFNAFRFLLSKLVENQNQIALELQSKIG